MTNERKALVNQAIAKVIFEKFKKDVKDEIRIIESAGYTVHKYDSRLEVSNIMTSKSVRLDDRYSTYHRLSKRYAVCYGPYRGMDSGFDSYEDVSKFDFVSCLETPLNKVYWTPENIRYTQYESDRINRYLLAKSDYDYDMRKISRMEKEIASLKKQLEDAERRLAEETGRIETYKNQFDIVRRSVGLIA